MKIASIDIGTNTCNLLIAKQKTNGKLDFLHREKQAITLINKNDINASIISQSSIDNLINILNNYKTKILNHQPQKIIITATSGIRSATNQKDILSNIKTHTDLDVEIIDGKREAELVYCGVKNAIKLSQDNFLIIDIGGGSIEFIIANGLETSFMQSYQIGVARILNKYKFEDPLTKKDINLIENILSENLSELFHLCRTLKISTLIGSSGSYETFANLIKYEFAQSNLRDDDSYNVINLDYFEKIHYKLINFDFEHRKNMPGMEIIRVQLIPIASVVTNYILKELNIKTLIQSNYSIKEGLIFDYLSQNKK
ncbi:MAG: hypothetical protein JXR36_11880 [Bacteroidales bacterium]|nr:hypothetical protein [Bacteroidales bacterium]